MNGDVKRALRRRRWEIDRPVAPRRIEGLSPVVPSSLVHFDAERTWESARRVLANNMIASQTSTKGLARGELVAVVKRIAIKTCVVK